MNSAIEAMARAICETRGMRWSRLTPFGLGNLRNEATAALTALAENITPEMVEAYNAHDVPFVESGFRAMCAAAVKGEGE